VGADDSDGLSLASSDDGTSKPLTARGGAFATAARFAGESLRKPLPGPGQ
jgi:hypothetical protein